MTQATIQLPDDLAKKVQSMDQWMPPILEISLLGFRTEAAATAELIEFTSDNPSPQEELDFHVSRERQARLEQLLSLKGTGLHSRKEQQELDEIEEIEHVFVMLKADIASKLAAKKG